ncbi:serine hydrolase domain-containing protein [Streptomyces amakusaensis]|uniref:Serine hydrolase domain-containing protein n=1 Tax=Streptomyces amakusaensis TaxID=67271 RepID=A0ABW0ASR8_9ACTN
MAARRMTRTRTRTRSRARTGTVGLLAAAVAATAFAAPAQAQDRPAQAKAPRHTATQQAMDAIVASGIPGMLAEARDGQRVWKGTSGVGNLKTGKARGKNDRFRIASITKTFVATVLLQMEAEGKLDLDDTVEKHLPGVVSGNGHDGSKITVRQLLNHTSGVYEYLQVPEYHNKYLIGDGFLKHRYDYRSPQVAVDAAMSHRPDFAPGTAYAYSNTNYVLAGLIIEKVAGDSYENQVRERIIKPLGLKATTVPGNSSLMPKPSSRAYSVLFLDPATAKVHDATLQNASQSWADGDMISSAGDLNRFFRALLRGELLPAEQLRAMKTTTAHSDDGTSAYGLGLGRQTTSCGIELWGHSGGWIGSLSNALSTEDGSRQVAFNLNGDWPKAGVADPVEAEFCGSGVPKGGAKGFAPLAPLAHLTR